MTERDATDALGMLPEDGRHRASLAANALREAVWDHSMYKGEP